MLLLQKDSLPRDNTGRRKSSWMGIERLRSKVEVRCNYVRANDNDFTRRYPDISAALRSLSNKRVIGGEVAVLDDGVPLIQVCGLICTPSHSQVQQPNRPLALMAIRLI